MIRLNTRPLVTLRSPLGEIDRRWMQEIEPYLFRPPVGHEAFGCWLWTGRVDQRGEPIFNQWDPIKRRRGTRVVKKLVGAIARLLLPGRQPIGILWTIVLGIVGAVAGGFLATEVFGIGDADEFDFGSFLIAVAASMLLLCLVSRFADRDRGEVVRT